MSYIVQQPRSNTNRTDKYQVVNFNDWIDCINGNGPSPESHGSYQDASAAREYCDKLNASTNAN